MMQQLLSKDVMYDPIKQICDRVRFSGELLLIRDRFESYSALVYVVS